jgi:hypothetical protein
MTPVEGDDFSSAQTRICASLSKQVMELTLKGLRRCADLMDDGPSCSAGVKPTPTAPIPPPAPGRVGGAAGKCHAGAGERMAAAEGSGYASKCYPSSFPLLEANSFDRA